MEPIVLKNEVIQDEATLKKCRQALNKLSNTVEMFPIERLGDKGKFISATLYNSYRLKATTDTITREFVWRTANKKSRPENYRPLESFGGIWDIMPERLSESFDEKLNGTWKEDTCEDCHGNGTQECENCNGSGKVKCKKCRGYGKIVVNKEVRCNGGDFNRGESHGYAGFEGYYYEKNTHYMRMREKGRSVYEICPDCHGSGIRTMEVDEVCPVCDGDKEVDCKECHGSGEVRCDNCHGTWLKSSGESFLIKGSAVDI